MQPTENSLWFAKMKNTLKVIKPTKFEVENYIFSTGFCGLKFNTEFVYIDYIFHYLLSDEFNKIKDSLSKGTTQEAVNNELISQILVPLPKLDIQIEESLKLNQIINEIELLEKKKLSSINLQKSLINQVF